MVQSSYKNRKKNRKQSFKRKNTDGNRKVKFIEDDDDNKMVGGDGEPDKINIKTALNQYAKHPLFGIILAAFSNSDCASTDTIDGECSTTNISSLNPSYNKCKEILKSLPELSEDGHKKPQAPVTPDNGAKLAHVKAVIDYLFQNAFLPKDLIQNVYVHNDDGASWTTLTKTNFKKDKPPESTPDRDAKIKANEKMKAAAIDSQGSDDDAFVSQAEEDTKIDSSQHINAAGSGKSGKQETVVAPDGAVTTGPGQGQYDAGRRKRVEDEQQNVDNVAKKKKND